MVLAQWRSADTSFARNARHTPGFVQEVASSALAEDARGKAPERHLFSLTCGDGIEVDLGKVLMDDGDGAGAISRPRQPSWQV